MELSAVSYVSAHFVRRLVSAAAAKSVSFFFSREPLQGASSVTVSQPRRLEDGYKEISKICRCLGGVSSPPYGAALRRGASFSREELKGKAPIAPDDAPAWLHFFAPLSVLWETRGKQ